MMLPILPIYVVRNWPLSQRQIYGNDAMPAAFSGGSLIGVIGDDEVSLTAGTGGFADAGVKRGKVVACGFSLSGPDAGDYQLTQPADGSADITGAGLTISG